MNSLINEKRYVPSTMNGHFDGYFHEGWDNVVSNCEIFFTTAPVAGKFYAIAYQGKSKNRDWYFSFKSEASMNEYIEEYVARCKASLEAKKQRKEEQKERDSQVKCEVGQLYVYSWGYDQTNIDYYQVTEVKGKKVTLRRIASNQVDGTSGYMCCNVVPEKDAFITKGFDLTLVKMLKASYDGQPYFSMSFGTLRLTSETQQSYCSWYA
jgi:hypothetical protein